MKISIFSQYSKKSAEISDNLSIHMKLIQVMIDNGGKIVVDLESFCTFNEITLTEAKKVESMCNQMKVKEAMLQFINLNNDD